MDSLYLHQLILQILYCYLKVNSSEFRTLFKLLHKNILSQMYNQILLFLIVVYYKTHSNNFRVHLFWKNHNFKLNIQQKRLQENDILKLIFYYF